MNKKITRTNIRIYSLKIFWHERKPEYIRNRKIYTNECPNIYSRPIYSNIRIYSPHSDVVPSVLFPCRHEEDPIIILVRSNYSVYIGRTSWPPVKRLLIAHHPPFISDNFLSFKQSSYQIEQQWKYKWTNSCENEYDKN